MFLTRNPKGGISQRHRLHLRKTKGEDKKQLKKAKALGCSCVHLFALLILNFSFSTKYSIGALQTTFKDELLYLFQGNNMH